METNRGAPTPPIAFGTEPSSVQRRFDVRVVDVDDGLLGRLRSACASVVTDDEVAVETGRDWWPLAMAWALDGTEPGRASVVVRPSSVDEVSAVLALCDEARVPVTATGGRSGVCGASVPVHGGVVLDTTAMSGIVDVDDVSQLLRVRAGTFGDVLEDELRLTYHATLGHWPQSMNLSTVGGWLACRSAGQFSTRYGKIEDMVVGMEVVLAGRNITRTGGA